MRTRRSAFTVIGALALGACTQDFGAFTLTGDGGAGHDGGDASNPSDAASFDRGPSDTGSGDVQACMPSQGCLDAATQCVSDCTTTEQMCLGNCSSQGCRQGCRNAFATCQSQCLAACNNCLQNTGCTSLAACADASG